MRCGQCGRQLTNAAQAMGYCPSCGTLLPDDVVAMATPPISRTIVEQAPAVALSQAASPYALAAAQTDNRAHGRISRPEPPPPPASGTSPPRRVVPDGRAEHETSVRPPVLSMPLPPVMLPPPRANVASPAAQPPNQVPPLITEITPRNNRPIMTALIALLIVFVIVSAGALIMVSKGMTTHTAVAIPTTVSTETPLPTATSLPTATPVPTVPPAPNGYATFISPDGTFGLNYQAIWNASAPNVLTGGTTYSFSATDLQAAQITETTRGIVVNSIVSDLQTYVISSNGTAFSATDGPIHDKQGANVWSRADGTFTQGTQTISVIGLAINYHDHGYIFIYSAPTASFNSLPGSAFAEMVNSFTFLR